MNIKRLLREPLVHFLLIGSVLFIVYGQIAAPSRTDASIVVSERMVDEMAREHEARWSRKPTDQELAGLVDAYVRDEILYREGLKLGLDRDDAQIKRRVRQKFEVISEEQSARGAPSDAELTAYMIANADRFGVPPTVSFEQVLIANSGTPADLERDVAAARAALARGADPSKLGQPSMLPRHIESAAQNMVARDFGEAFARQVESVPVGQWSSIESGYGVHLVRVTARSPAIQPKLDSIRQAVAREWENDRRTIARSDSYQALRSNYTVVIETRKLASVAAQR